jgi:hypothetical protein
MIYTDKDIKRFWKKVNKTDSCWNWSNCIIGHGYGGFKINRKIIRAHRFSWLLYFGEIPIRMLVCHKCDNPKCVNPEHLFLGTNKDNTNDMIQKGRGNKAKGEKQGFSKLTEEQVINIRKEYIEGNISYSKLSKKYNVVFGTIAAVLTNKTWKHI